MDGQCRENGQGPGPPVAAAQLKQPLADDPGWSNMCALFHVDRELNESWGVGWDLGDKCILLAVAKMLVITVFSRRRIPGVVLCD